MFCTSCGSRLEPGARFCTVCGAAAAADQPTAVQPAQDQPPVNLLKQPDVVPPPPPPPPPTVAMPAMQPQPVGAPQQRAGVNPWIVPLLVAALLVGGAIAWYLSAGQQSSAEGAPPAGDPGTDTAGGGQPATGGGSPAGETAAGGDACAGMLGDQPVSGDYVVLWENSDVLFQESYSLQDACRIAAQRFGGDVRIMDSTDYWDLNIDLKRYGIWTVFSGPYDKATAQRTCSQRGSCNVRLIQPCSRNDGQACGG